MADDAPKLWLTPREAAVELAVSEDTIRCWIGGKQLRAHNCSATPASKKPRWRIARTSLTDFLQRRASCARPKPRTKAPDTGGIIEWIS